MPPANPAHPTEDLTEDSWLAEDPVPPLWLTCDPAPHDPEDIDAWLDRELAKAAPSLDADSWLDEDPGPAARAVEVFKAGRWDRTQGDGGGFAAGGGADRLPPGPVLAGLAADRWAEGLDRLSDDELIGMLRAARRLASWAAAMELAAAGDLWARRTAEEDAGDTGAAFHADAEVAAALTLTRRAADNLLALAVALDRLPGTRAALTAGDIDLPRAMVIADEVTGLTGAHAAAVEAAIIGAAPGQTTGQVRHAARRAVLAADPGAARKRKEEALRQARVERWSEPAGTAALAGRDLPPAEVLAADANLTALSKQLKAAGVEGTLDTLRAKIYLALLAGTPVAALLPTGRDTPAEPGTGAPASPKPSPPPSGLRGGAGITGRVNLTLPLATWLGHGDAPGHAAGFGPLDATDSRALAGALATGPGTRWCLTITGPTGQPLAHGCARTGPSPRGHPAQPAPATGPRAGPPTKPAVESPGRAATADHGRPAARSRGRPSAGPVTRPAAAAPKRPGTRAGDGTWTVTFTPLDDGKCDHAWETPAYRPPEPLRHRVQIRHATCVFPGCRRPTAQCDADHTLAYERGGKTCLCNLAPLCRHHHEVKQTPGWTLKQSTPGVLTWTTPSGRTYTITPTEYPE